MKHAVVAVIRRDDRLLLIQRGPDVPMAGYWAPLSGKIEPGETQAQAVEREVREEVGLVVHAVEKVWECPAEGADYRLHWWTVEIIGGELVPDPTEIADARWLTIPEIHALDRTFAADVEFFERVLPGL